MEVLVFSTSYVQERLCARAKYQQMVPEAAPRVLDIQLKEMVEDGLVVKQYIPNFLPRSEYRITELGQSLIPIIDLMLKWGREHFDILKRIW